MSTRFNGQKHSATAAGGTRERASGPALRLTAYTQGMSEYKNRQTSKSRDEEPQDEQPEQVETSDVDDILDEIDEVLEVNAKEFVESYVQRGGE